MQFRLGRARSNSFQRGASSKYGVAAVGVAHGAWTLEPVKRRVHCVPAHRVRLTRTHLFHVNARFPPGVAIPGPPNSAAGPFVGFGSRLREAGSVSILS